MTEVWTQRSDLCGGDPSKYPQLLSAAQQTDVEWDDQFIVQEDLVGRWIPEGPMLMRYMGRPFAMHLGKPANVTSVAYLATYEHAGHRDAVAELAKARARTGQIVKHGHKLHQHESYDAAHAAQGWHLGSPTVGDCQTWVEKNDTFWSAPPVAGEVSGLSYATGWAVQSDAIARAVRSVGGRWGCNVSGRWHDRESERPRRIMYQVAESADVVWLSQWTDEAADHLRAHGCEVVLGE